MEFEEYKRKLLEEDEHKRLAELQAKYNGMGIPDYANMSLRDELQTRFDLDELNNLQQKYGVRQTSIPQSQMTASAHQPYASSNYSKSQHYPMRLNQPTVWENTINGYQEPIDIEAVNSSGDMVAHIQANKSSLKYTERLKDCPKLWFHEEKEND